MAFLVTVLVGHLARVFHELVCVAVPITIFSIEGVDPGSWNKTFSSLFTTAVIILFLLFFSSPLNNFFGMLKGYWPSFLVLKLRLLNPKIFHGVSLIASFVTLYRLFVTGNALVYFSEYRGGQETSLGLSINSFLYQLFLIV